MTLPPEIEVHFIEGLYPKVYSSAGSRYVFSSGTELRAYTYDPNISPITKLATTRWNSTASSKGVFDHQNGSAVEIAQFEAVHVSHWPSTDVKFPPATAWRCRFEFCEKTYESVDVINGTTTAKPPLEAALYMDNLDDGPPLIDGPSGSETVALFSMTTKSSPPGIPRRIYKVNVSSPSNLGVYLTQMFTSGWFDNGVSTREKWVNFTAPDIGRELAASSNLEQTAKRMAESMTEPVRTSPNSTAQVGKGFVTRSFIKVQW